MKKVMADTENGVYFVSELKYCEILSQEDFFDALGGLRDNETIGAEIDAEMEEILKNQYEEYDEQ